MSDSDKTHRVEYLDSDTWHELTKPMPLLWCEGYVAGAPEPDEGYRIVRVSDDVVVATYLSSVYV